MIVSTKTFYPHTVSQTSGGKYRTFKDLNVIKNTDNGYAISNGDILGKKSSPNRPSTITCTDFRCKLPVGSIINKITVEVKHGKTGESNKTSCNIPAPMISLMYNGHVAYTTKVTGADRYEYTYKGQAAKMVVDDFTITFNGKRTVSKKKILKYELLSRNVVNDSSFGVRVDYPTNTNTYSGKIKVYWVRIKVDYTPSSYGLSMSKVTGGYNGEDYHLRCSINRKSKTSYVPSVTIVSPTGATFKGVEGTGKVVQVNNHTFTWTPDLSKSVTTSKASVELVFEVNVTFPFGATYQDILFSSAESLYGVSTSHTAHITERPESSDEDEPDTPDTGVVGDEYLLRLRQYYDEEGTLLHPYFYINFTDDQKEKYNQHGQGEVVVIDGVTYGRVSFISLVWTDKDNGTLHLPDVELENSTQWEVYTLDDPAPIPHDDFTLDDEWGLSSESNGVFVLKLRFFEEVKYFNGSTGQEVPSMKEEYYTDIGLIYFEALPDPSELNPPSFTILQPTTEELNRLGDGYGYTVQTYLEEQVPYTETTLFSDSEETSLTNDSPQISYERLEDSEVTNLPEQFELEFKFKGANNFTSRIVLCPTDEYVEEGHIPNYLYCGKYKGNLMSVGARTNGIMDYTYVKSVGEEYNTFKIVRKDLDTFEFYENGTLVHTMTVDWFKNHYGYELALINWGNGATCSVDDITLKAQVPTESYVRDWYKNFRIGVYNNSIGEPETVTYINEDGETVTIEYDPTDYDTLTPAEIFENAKYWSACPTSVNTYTNLECPFQYDADYPLYVIITGDYNEADNPEPVNYTEPCIIETAVYTEREKNGNYPVPIRNLITGDDTAQLELSPYTNSSPIVFYDLPVDTDFGTNEDIAIRGVEITGNIEQADTQILKAQLKDNKGNTGERSIIITDTDTVVDNDVDFSVGAEWDLWGYSMLDYNNIPEWQFQLQLSNTLENTNSNINFNDVEITFYTETIEHQNIECFINDENISFYNAFITDVTIPPGLETDVSFLSIDGTDTNDAYRQNVKEKTIELELEVGDTCDLETNTATLRQLIRLLTNDKDKYNRPIPKHVRFSHYPDVYFEYIIKDSPDVEIDINTYKVKIKMVIPSGTSYDINNTLTGNTGYVQGLVGVEPIIQITPVDTTIQISETVTGQKFNIGYTGDWNGKIVELDCEDRIVWLKETEDDPDPVNISQYADFNSDWFVLKGEYHFETINSVFKTVSYIERE